MLMILSEFCTMEPSLSLPHFQGYVFSLLKVTVVWCYIQLSDLGLCFAKNMIVNSKLLKLDT